MGDAQKVVGEQHAGQHHPKRVRSVHFRPQRERNDVVGAIVHLHGHGGAPRASRCDDELAAFVSYDQRARGIKVARDEANAGRKSRHGRITGGAAVE